MPGGSKKKKLRCVNPLSLYQTCSIIKVRAEAEEPPHAIARGAAAARQLIFAQLSVSALGDVSLTLSPACIGGAQAPERAGSSAPPLDRLPPASASGGASTSSQLVNASVSSTACCGRARARSAGRKAPST